MFFKKNPETFYLAEGKQVMKCEESVEALTPAAMICPWEKVSNSKSYVFRLLPDKNDSSLRRIGLWAAP